MEDDSLLMNETSSFSNKGLAVRVVVGATCVLSMLGAVSILLSYACIKGLKSQGRTILLNLSLMDFGVGLFNFLGAVINFNQYYTYYDPKTGLGTPNSSSVEKICISQAFLAHFCTGASVLWTAWLAVYMYMLVFQVYFGSKKFLSLGFAICYGLPLGMSVWLLMTNRLGYSIYNEAAWCGLIVSNSTDLTGLPDYLAITIGYDIWIYLTIILTATIYPVLFTYLHIEYGQARKLVGGIQYWREALVFLDVKLIAIPIAFVILRMWTAILNILIIYAMIPPDNLPTAVSTALIYLSGIGDSGQGFVNGLLFVFLTREVRKRLFCKRRHKQEDKRPLLTSENQRIHENVRCSERQRTYSPSESLRVESDVDS